MERLGHILTKTAQRHIDAAGIDRNVVVAGQLIELLLHLLGCELVGAQIVEIIGGISILQFGFLAKIVAER